MDWNILKEISVDFIDSKYISVNAKKNDHSGRVIRITCKNQGNLVKIDRNTMYAFARYRRADGKGILSPCVIDDDGKVNMRLTKKMLDVTGKCYVDIIFIESDTPRSPIAENGFFIADYIYDEENKSLQTLFTPELNTIYKNGSLTIDSIIIDGKKISVCANPAPFVVGNKDGAVTFAAINENGEITCVSKSVSSTMTFCVNVIDSSFYGKCVEIIR